MVLQIDDESYNVYVMLAKFQILGKAKPIEKKTFSSNGSNKAFFLIIVLILQHF